MQVTFCFKAPNTLYDNNKSQKIKSDWKTNLEGKEKGRRIFDIKVDHFREIQYKQYIHRYTIQ